ncbi:MULTISPECIES: hypothetical protein [Spirulina sp. CCY15215]|uniref:hypothetical protein n=1 Tax=Spirulina sp. CCY15215 TaxID=2767591 RepID=UPI00194DF56B|nr:hypothetical protein [Spirulina major]
MNLTKPLISACRHCRFYTPEGRRGGTCQKLNVPVQSCWKACSLAAHPFATVIWKKWDSSVLRLEHSFSLEDSQERVESL